MVRFYSLEKDGSRIQYNPYAKTCKKCHRLIEMWSKTSGIGFNNKCLCKFGLTKSNDGDSIYGS